MIYCGIAESGNSHAIPNQQAKDFAMADKILQKRPASFKDITGRQYGSFVVNQYLGNRRWQCTCVFCGLKKNFRSDWIKNKADKCFCQKLNRLTNSPSVPQNQYKAHTPYREKLEGVYDSMIHRCYNPKNVGYKYYGKRGVTVCNQWLNNRRVFYKWALENGYSPSLQIDRIDNKDGYNPENCRFVDKRTQANNRRSNVYITYLGKRMSLSECSRLIFGERNPCVISRRLRSGWSEEEAIGTPINKNLGPKTRR